MKQSITSDVFVESAILNKVQNYNCTDRPVIVLIDLFV